jgi:hypothetical protein
VGHHYPCHASSACITEQSHHRLSVDRVEGTGGLVGEKEAPVADHGAGDGDTLLFTT